MSIRELTCINCPLGCALEVEIEDGRVVSVKGNTCPRGDRYARTEVLNPVRTVTSSADITGGMINRVPVKTLTPVPKSSIFSVMEDIRRLRVSAPVHEGDVLISGVGGTDSDLVATRTIEKI